MILSFDLKGVSGGIPATFWYDGDGKRVKATIGEVTTSYFGDYFDWTGSTSTMINCIYANDQCLAMKKGSTVYLFFADHLGSTTITAKTSRAKWAKWARRKWASCGTRPGVTTIGREGQRTMLESPGLDCLRPINKDRSHPAWSERF